MLSVLAAGVALRLAWLAIGMWHLRRVVSRATPDHTIHQVLETILVGYRDRVEVRISDDVDGPATVGVFRPVILLPRRILELPAAIQRAALVHELVHVRRRDWMATRRGSLVRGDVVPSGRADAHVARGARARDDGG
jgi:beta-lactamase regulating signal transducer with metallopeptidase domain